MTAVRCASLGWASGVGLLQQLQMGAGVARCQGSQRLTLAVLGRLLSTRLRALSVCTLPHTVGCIPQPKVTYNFVAPCLEQGLMKGRPGRDGAKVSLTLLAKKNYWQRLKEKREQEQAAEAAEAPGEVCSLPQ